MHKQKKYLTEIQEAKHLNNDDLVSFVVNKIIEHLSRKFVFGYNTHEDIAQEIWILSLKGLKSDKFNPAFPIEKYLYKVVKRGLINLKRDKFLRSAPPCHTCPFYLKKTQGCELYGDDKLSCAKYRLWCDRNKAKVALGSPASTFINYSDCAGDTVDEHLIIEEISTTIYIKLSDEHKILYKELLQYKEIPTKKVKELEAAVLKILMVKDAD